MESQPEAEVMPGRTCKRPGCGQPIPEDGGGRGRPRVFCSSDCARKFHNSARPSSVAAVAAVGEQDPLAALGPLLQQGAALVKAAREQAEGLDPARVRVEIADAEAARRRAEAAVVTAQARQAEAESEAGALAEALDAARDDKSAGEIALTEAEERAALLEAEIDVVRSETDQRVAAATEHLRGQVATAETEAERARQELEQVREDAARERDALQASCESQLQAQKELTEAERARAERAEDQLAEERAERWQLTTSLSAKQNGRTSSGNRTAKKTGQRRTAAAATSSAE